MSVPYDIPGGFVGERPRRSQIHTTSFRNQQRHRRRSVMNASPEFYLRRGTDDYPFNAKTQRRTRHHTDFPRPHPIRPLPTKHGVRGARTSIHTRPFVQPPPIWPSPPPIRRVVEKRIQPGPVPTRSYDPSSSSRNAVVNQAVNVSPDPMQPRKQAPPGLLPARDINRARPIINLNRISSQPRNQNYSYVPAMVNRTEKKWRRRSRLAAWGIGISLIFLFGTIGGYIYLLYRSQFWLDGNHAKDRLNIPKWAHTITCLGLAMEFAVVVSFCMRRKRFK